MKTLESKCFLKYLTCVVDKRAAKVVVMHMGFDEGGRREAALGLAAGFVFGFWVWRRVFAFAPRALSARGVHICFLLETCFLFTEPR